MSNKAFIIISMLLMPVVLMAQDFTTIFIEEHKADSNLVIVTISPKMMEEILKDDAGKDDNVLEMISDLKSMQMLSADVNAKPYYQKALELIGKSEYHYEPFIPLEEYPEGYRIMVRKKNDKIVELVMLIHYQEHFTIIDFTGDINREFIIRLADSVEKTEQSVN